MQILKHKDGKTNGTGKKRKNIKKRKAKKSKTEYRVVTQDLDDPEIELYLPYMSGNQAPSWK